MSAVGFLQYVFLFEDGQRAIKTRIEFCRQCYQVNHRRTPKRQQAAEKHQDAQHGYPAQGADEGRHHKNAGAQLLYMTRGFDEASPEP